MNWINWRRLRDELTALLKTPRKFDYWEADPTEDAVCLACVCTRVDASCAVFDEQLPSCLSPATIVRLLECSQDEAQFLYCPMVKIDGGMTSDESIGVFIGESGIHRAIQKLDTLAQRYGGEPAPAPQAQPIRTPDQFVRDLQAEFSLPQVIHEIE